MYRSTQTQTRLALDAMQGELRSERTLRQVAEAAASKLELEVKKLKADLQVYTCVYKYAYDKGGNTGSYIN